MLAHLKSVFQNTEGTKDSMWKRDPGEGGSPDVKYLIIIQPSYASLVKPFCHQILSTATFFDAVKRSRRLITHEKFFNAMDTTHIVLVVKKGAKPRQNQNRQTDRQ